LSAYVRNNIVKALVLIVLLLVGIGFASHRYQQELLTVTREVFEYLGLFGLSGLIFITDSFVSPFPPDLVLIVVAKSELAASWWWVVPGVGVVSVAAGHLGYYMGCWVRGVRRLEGPVQRFSARNARLVARYGSLGVALGALTPIPFSITCWTAGILQLPYRRFLWPCLLRLPRYLAYYLAIAHADTLTSWLFG
jgi:membrane protein YqaA with SNARE-associated domain